MRALVVALACLMSVSCGDGHEPPQPLVSNAAPAGEPGQTADLEPQTGRTGTHYVGTGEAFDGTFALKGAVLTMTAAGEYTRVRANGVTEGGSYLVTEDGRLVLFLERIGESRLTTAAPEVHPRAELIPAP